MTNKQRYIEINGQQIEFAKGEKQIFGRQYGYPGKVFNCRLFFVDLFYGSCGFQSQILKAKGVK